MAGHISPNISIMALCTPLVLGPLSELSTAVRVQGQVAGAKLTVLSLPGLNKVAAATATSGDQYIPLIPGVQLAHTDLLVAMQELGGETSALPTDDQGMAVQQGPQTAADLGGVGLATHLFGCGQFVWVTNMIPGASATVAANGQVLGSGPGQEGFARLALTQGLPTGGIVTAHQFAKLPSAVVAAGPDFVGLADAPPVTPHVGLRLPPPVIASPLRHCDRAILITKVTDGARVTVHRSSGVPDESAGFDVDSLWFELQSELKEGEEVTVKQDLYMRCELLGAWSAPTVVGPLGVVEPPVISQPLCKGMQRLVLQQLRPGAAVTIFANGTAFQGTAPTDGTVGTFGIPPLSSDTVTAIQAVCGVPSLASAVAPVENHPESIPPVELLGPLFRCAHNVSVRNVHPGAVLQVFAESATTNVRTPISGQVSVFEPQAIITVAPLLRTDDRVTVAQWACAGKRTDSNAVAVKALGPTPAPHVLDALRADDQDVLLWGVVPGAYLEVYVQINANTPRQLVGTGFGNALFASLVVHCAAPLHAGNLVSARQLLCDWSDIQRPVQVGRRPGFGPRPFYLFGHNPNTIQDVKNALHDGANAIEPDVNVYEDDESRLCINHDEGEAGTVSLQQYLTELRKLALQDSRLAMVVFDCKAKTTTPEHGLTLLTAIRNFLTFDTGLNIIISVSDFGSAGIFKHIAHLLGPREGLMIDEENDPIAVSNLFQQAGAANQAYGNGISIPNMPVTAPHVRPSMERACAFRAARGRLKFIYVWTVNNESLKREFIRTGVDGIISDNVVELLKRVREKQFQNLIRVATRLDNPVQPANFAYSLAIHTADRGHAGTDANITFTLTGTFGSASKTVNTKLRFRMEADEWNFVTLHSPDLGPLLTMTVQRDNQGNAPDWFLDKIEVQSARFGVLKTATFNRDIDSTAPFTAPLV